MKKINICICTCKRELLLVQCLGSVASIKIPLQTQVLVTIIDNDGGRSAEPVVQKLQSDYPMPLHYHHEASRGIPFARNRALDEAYNVRSDYIAFIDDDEWVEPDWLVNLYDFCQLRGGDIIVSGDVVPEFPPQVPPEIRGLFQRKNHMTGQELKTCATNNVLFPVSLAQRLSLRFDERNPLAGGTDTIYFVEAVSRGAAIFKCCEALVHETVPLSRASIRWLAKRKYRAGITEAWRKRRKGRMPALIVISSLVQIVIGLIKCAFMIASGRKLERNMCVLKVCKFAGVISGVFGASVQSYKIIES